MFEQAFKNIDDVLWKEAGCSSELDYTEQTSWLLFQKYLDGLEQDLADQAALEGRAYTYILDEPYRWDVWAAPKDAAGRPDYNAAMTGDDLRDFVNGRLFPYLHGFRERATGPNTIAYKIGEIFGEIKNKIQSGYNMREIIDHIDELRFRSQAEKHELSHLYEAKIRNMGNAGRNGGEYYTPRPLIRAMVKVTKPQLGETIYDGAVGSAGFLCASGVPFITISNISKDNREIDFSDTFMVTEEYFANLKPNKKPRPGDVLYTVTGATLGIPVLVTKQADFCFQRHIGLIRPKPDTDSRWLSYAMLSPQVFRQASLGSTGAAQKTVSLAVLRSIMVPRVRLSAQRAMADEFDSLSLLAQCLESIYQRKRAALDELRRSLLHQAFSGRL